MSGPTMTIFSTAGPSLVRVKGVRTSTLIWLCRRKLTSGHSCILPPQLLGPTKPPTGCPWNSTRQTSVQAVNPRRDERDPNHRWCNPCGRDNHWPNQCNRTKARAMVNGGVQPLGGKTNHRKVVACEHAKSTCLLSKYLYGPSQVPIFRRRK